jgi:hypothetical protein
VKTIETTTDIDAPPEVVWEVITDFARYREWNPFITELLGELQQGARLRATFALAGRKPQTFTPTLTDVDPNRRLVWNGRLAVPKLFDAEHIFEVAPHGTGSRLVHREHFRGVLVPLLRSTLTATHDAFTRMDAELAQRAEALAAPLPTSPPATTT